MIGLNLILKWESHWLISAYCKAQNIMQCSSVLTLPLLSFSTFNLSYKNKLRISRPLTETLEECSAHLKEKSEAHCFSPIIKKDVCWRAYYSECLDIRDSYVLKLVTKILDLWRWKKIAKCKELRHSFLLLEAVYWLGFWATI